MSDLTVDYIENNMVVLEYGEQQLVLPRAWFPEALEEGDIVNVSVEQLAEERSSVSLALNATATKEKHEAMKTLRESLVQGPSGDIEL